MKLSPENIYHIYNQGNNRQNIFFDREDYLLFLNIYREVVFRNCETLCYCLMPNHFHFLVYATDKSVIEKKLGSIVIQNLSDGFRKLLSKYAHEMNNKSGSVGSLFRQKTQAKLVEGISESSGFSYAEQCFFYIHQNPVTANIAERNTDWEFSSAKDFSGQRNGTLCNKDLAFKLFGWEKDDLTFFNHQQVISSKTIELFFEQTKKLKSDRGQTK